MVEEFVPAVLSGHKDNVLGAWFSNDNEIVYTVSKDGALFEWKYQNVNQSSSADQVQIKKQKNNQLTATKPTRQWRVTQKHYFMQNNSKVISCSFHAKTNILTVGFSTGIFSIYELPDFTNIHSLSISQKKIDAMDINCTGEWIAFGCSKLGQLLVWEWQSESHVLKQQGHSYDMSCLAYSPDGQFVATGGDDGKIKLWNTQSGFSFITFSEHQGGITSLEFAKQGQIVFSSSLDGTIRAFDLIRYRNFKTFASPNPVQFSCLAVDATGDVICAGSIDTFEIYMWSVQTGKLLDIFAGHTGPISSLCFSPIDGTLASASWDKTVRIWNVFSRDVSSEPHQHDHEIITIAYRPDGRQLAVSTLDGQIHFWDLQVAKLVSSIEGRKDIGGGRKATDRMSAANAANTKSFNSLCYTADGSCIIGGGTSKYICIYDVLSSALLKRFQISHNQSLDGMQEFLNSKNMTAAGPLDLIDDPNHSDLEDRMDTSLPGVLKGDASLRKTRPEARTKCVRFSPTGRSWGAATTEGLLIYSLDDHIIFDPYDL
jgi:periodic tryptophan protein 2